MVKNGNLKKMMIKKTNMEKVIKTKRFKKMLEKGKVHFEYTKKDGTLRESVGTRKVELIPENMQPK
jgi:hypothetical protein